MTRAPQHPVRGLFSLVALLTFLLPSAATAQSASLLVVIGSNVACREAPDTSAPVTVRYRLGELFVPRAERETTTGLWYNSTTHVRGARSSGCWVHGSLTTGWDDRERALVTIADHALSRADAAPLEDYVAVDNLLQQTPPRAHSDSSILESSPLLQLRRLQVLEKAAGGRDAWGRSVRRDPLKAAWFFANEDVLRYHEPAGGWMVTADVYWRLYERHRQTRWAEEIAWTAAQGGVPADECDAGCVLDRLVRTYARYWEDYPEGRWVADAVSEARRQALRGARAGCSHSSGERVQQLADRLRAGLASVRAAGRDELGAHIAQMEHRCAGT